MMLVTNYSQCYNADKGFDLLKNMKKSNKLNECFKKQESNDGKTLRDAARSDY